MSAKAARTALETIMSFWPWLARTLLRSDWLIVRYIVEEGESASYRLNVIGGLDVTYGDLTVVNGDTFMDTLMINGATIPSADLGLARTVDTVMSDIIGVMGLGFDNSVPKSYPSIIRNMLAKGIIGIAVYSLWLSPDRRTGSIYFGGIEPGGLFEALVILDVAKDGGKYKFLKVAYQNLAIQTPDDQDLVNIPIGAQQPAATAVVLDSGTGDLYLPIDQWLFLVMKVGAVDAGDQDTFIVDCGVQDWDGGVDFTFSGFTVQVHFSERVEEDDNGTCYFKVQPSLANNILGDNFLRQVFVVYDLAAKRIAMSHAV